MLMHASAMSRLEPPRCTNHAAQRPSRSDHHPGRPLPNRLVPTSRQAEVHPQFAHGPKQPPATLSASPSSHRTRGKPQAPLPPASSAAFQSPRLSRCCRRCAIGDATPRHAGAVCACPPHPNPSARPRTHRLSSRLGRDNASQVHQHDHSIRTAPAPMPVLRSCSGTVDSTLQPHRR